jgi:hypothetical protein
VIVPFILISAIALFLFSALGPVVIRALRTGSLQLSRGRVAKREDAALLFWSSWLFIVAGLAWTGFRWVQLGLRVFG